jgi:hypothetical protein
MSCNAWNHPANCRCAWGGAHQRKRLPDNLLDIIHRRQPRAVRLARFTIPDARCPVCGARVFFHEGVGGGRVFLDSLGPPWPKHPCTDRPNWKWRKLGSADEIRAKAGAGPAEIRGCTWRTDGWAPVLSVERRDGRPTDSFMTSLVGATVWVDGGEDTGINLLWPVGQEIDWRGPVFMRRRPMDPSVVEFQSIQIIRGAPRSVSLVAIFDDPDLPGDSLVDRLRRAA